MDVLVLRQLDDERLMRGVRRIGYRRVKVRWVTPLGDETASMS